MPGLIFSPRPRGSDSRGERPQHIRICYIRQANQQRTTTLVNNAGLILPATLALHLGLLQPVGRHLGRAPDRANRGD